MKKLFGETIDLDSVGDRKDASNVTPRQIIEPIHLSYWFRNPLFPDAQAMNLLGRTANACILHRTKQYFTMIAGTQSMLTSAAGAGDRARFRFAFKTGAYAHAMGVLALLVPQDTNASANAHARIDISTSPSGSPVAVSAEFVHGAAPNQSDGFAALTQLVRIVDGLDPSTEYYATWYDVSYCRLLTACCWELPSMTETNQGYLSTRYTMGSAVTSADRGNLMVATRNLWTTCGAGVLAWSVNDGTTPVTRLSSTPVNVVDGTTTTTTSADPGFVLDMRNKARLSQESTGVPVVMKVYGSNTTDTAGSVVLLDSTGATVLTASNFSTTAGWVSTTGYLPATLDTYHLMVAGDGAAGTTSVYAVSIWEQD